MGLSRKRQRELNRLKNQAEHLWEDQKEVLDQANKVVRDARKQAAAYTREEVAPRVREGVAGARAVASSAAGTARERFVDDVLPAVSSALGSALAALEAAKSPQVREAFAKVSKAGTSIGTRVGIVKPPPPPGPGRYILIGLGVVAAAAVAYAAWQTLRADDDLWIDDEPAALEEDLQ